MWLPRGWPRGAPAAALRLRLVPGQLQCGERKPRAPCSWALPPPLPGMAGLRLYYSLQLPPGCSPRLLPRRQLAFAALRANVAAVGPP